MSHAANPNKPKKTAEETSEAELLRQQKQEREKIRRIIITLGDNDKQKVLGQIKGAVGALEDDIELHGELIRQTVLDCASNLPFKPGIIAVWVTRMSGNHADWVSSVVSKALEDLRTCIRTGQFLHAQLLLRFIVGLGNTGLVALPEVLQLLQEVMALSNGLRPSKGGDLGVFLALTALPFLSPAAYGLAAEKVDALVAAAGTYLTARDAKWKPLVRVLKNEVPLDNLEAVAAMLESLKEAGWTAEAVFHIKSSEPCMEAKDTSPHLAPLGITAEDIKKTKVRVPVPLVSCKLITSKMLADGAEVMPMHDRWLLEDYILATIEAFARDVEECSKQLLRFPFMHTLFEAAIIETIFSQMLRLPSPPLLPLFYSRLFQALVEKEPSLLVVVNKGFTGLFEQIADLDEESFEVLAEAWAYHLINQEYKADWAPFTGDKASPQVQRFLRRVFERLQRLSFHQNLLHRLPESVHAYVPPEPVPAKGMAAQSKPEYVRMLGFVKIKDPNQDRVLRYCERLLGPQAVALPVDEPVANEEEGEAEFAPADEAPMGNDEEENEEARAAKRARPDEEAAAGLGDGKEAGESEKKRQKVQVKEEVKQEAKKEEDADDFGELPEPLPLDSVVEMLALVVFQHGAKTPTHMSKILDGHQQVFLKLRPTDEDQAHDYVKAIVRSVVSFWSLSGQRLEITLETLLQRGIVTPRAVVEQSLGERIPEVCDRMSIWNMINSVARKSLERTQSIRVELAIAKKLEKEDVLEKCRKQLDSNIHETAELFTLIFTELVRSHQDWEDKDAFLRNIAVQRVLMIGRKYHSFIKPLVDSAEQRIPGVAHNPDIAAIFQSLRAL